MDAQALTSQPYPWYRLRETAYDEIYVSPHMDDAVYSCGGQIALERAAGKRILIVTVFGDGRSYADDAPPRPEAGVFGDIPTRKREERAAIERLDVDHLWLNLPDLLVRPKRLGELLEFGLPFVELSPGPLQVELYATLEALLRTLLATGGHVFFPLAVGAHPDHRIVHTVGRALARQPLDLWFYEDVPYTQVPALREERLHHLGHTRSTGALAAAHQVHDFAFAHAPGWQRPLSTLGVLGHTLFTRLLFALRKKRPALLRTHDLRERDVHDVIATKVEAIRAYVTQTAFFFPPGDAIYQTLTRSGDRYIERYWRLPAADRIEALIDAAHSKRERKRAQALLDEITSQLF